MRILKIHFFSQFISGTACGRKVKSFANRFFLPCSTPMPSLEKILEHGLTAGQIKHGLTLTSDVFVNSRPICFKCHFR